MMMPWAPMVSIWSIQAHQFHLGDSPHTVTLRVAGGLFTSYRRLQRSQLPENVVCTSWHSAVGPVRIRAMSIRHGTSLVLTGARFAD